ncbi:phosphodiester glycosidase family protein [Bacteroides sp. 519]|uniref:phosphodiester glycosidase family protein n=1 Tax=Bacteroides sp. 519 TaxID=2302937 RepID=UPI0013D83077|nr:phosphodiester glycosidase family protein [Bacteroides sp. 519]NDV58445.1 hypothetical protein [Bacteroides sp. 519]
MKDKKQDNEVYILGSETGKGGKKKIQSWKWILAVVCVLLILGSIFYYYSNKEQTPDYYFEPEETQQSISVSIVDTIQSSVENGYIEVLEEVVNDVPLLIYVPHKLTMSLALGMPDVTDPDILFATMAADIRRDNKQIVGDFVLAGKRLARGVAKKGFCAIENNKVTIGLGESTPLLQQVIDSKGSFFRQYPLVHNGELIENKPKNKSVRRALAVRNERIIMVESKQKESFHDFSQALIDVGVTDAIYLVGGDAYGWYYNKEHVRREFGEQLSDLPENISYIIWRNEE